MRKAIAGAAGLLMLLTLGLGGAQGMDLRLGTIEARSQAGEPVEARIPLRNVRPDQLAVTEVGLAPSRTFSRAGLERPPELSALDFGIVAEGADAPYIEITSGEPIDLPLLDFLVEVRWPEGNLVREYTLLMEPPTTAGPGVPDVAAANVEGPRVEEVAGTADPANEGGNARQGATVYGPVEDNDTLWSIAREHRPSEDVTVAQTMMAIKDLNPRAFRDDNVNNLLTGWWLRMPTREQALERSAAQAQREYQAQLDAWVPPAERRAPDEEPEVVEEPPVEEVPEELDEEALEARLEVLAPDDVEGEDLVALLGEDMEPTEENIERLQRQLAIAHETRESLQAERDDLARRVDELAQRVEDLERLLELRAPGALPPREEEEPTVPVPEVTEPEEELDPHPVETVPRMPEEPEVAEEDEDEPFWARWLSDDFDPVAETREAWDDPDLRYFLLIGAGAALLLVAGGLMGLQRRRKRRIEAERQQRLRLSPDDLEFDFDNMPERGAAAAPRQSEEDMVDRAQGHLDQGNPRSARQELLNGLEQQPHRSDARLKLMEIQADLDDREGFNNQAKALRGRVRSDSDPLWQAALSIGQRFNPPLPDSDDAGGGDDELDAKPELDELDYGLDDEDEDLEQRLDEVFGGEEDEAGGEDRETAQAAEAAEAPRDAGKGAAEEVGDELEEMDLDSLLSEEEAEETAGAGEPEPEPEEETALGAGEGDEVDTKLDLARAYIDLGDEQGARELLEEALEEGTENQRSTARRLLSELGDE